MLDLVRADSIAMLDRAVWISAGPMLHQGGIAIARVTASVVAIVCGHFGQFRNSRFPRPEKVSFLFLFSQTYMIR